MRNKQLNIEGITSISKGGVLYRSGEVANLTKEQIAQAKLVSKLPSDFPLANWESMSTKQQLHAMKFSGLNEKDQWDLLNSKVPLIVLDQHNQLHNRIDSAYLAARPKATPGKSTISTSLQNDTLRQKIDISKLEQKKKSLGKANGAVGAAIAPRDTGNETSSPRPTPPSLPQPGPTPVVTPSVDNETNSLRESPLIELTPRDKQMLLGLLNMDKNLMSVSDRKLFELVERQVQKGDITENQLNRYYNEVTRIRDKVMKEEWVNKVKDSSDDSALWGIGLINDQSIYSGESGSFGVLGNLKNNGCGLVAMNNANYHLGLNIRYDDFVKEMQGYDDLATNAFGLLGMNPDMIGIYNHLGAEVTTYNFPINIPTDHDAYIIMYIYTSGAHYIEAQYDKENNCYEVYNTGVSDDVAVIPDLTPSEYRSYEQSNRRAPTPIIHWVVWGIDALAQPMIDIPGSAVEENY